jgi:tRNA(Ile)-lysidine synthetase-like protein
VTLIRPLLEIPRAVLEAYCHAKYIAYVVDASNFDERYPRTKIRERILPEIERVFGGEGFRGIFRSAELHALAATFISSETEKVLTYSLVSQDSAEIILDYSRLSSYFSLLRLGIIQRAARLAGGDEVRISFERCLAADKTIERSTRPIQLGEGLSIRRWSGRLYVYADPPTWQPQSFSPARGALIPGIGFLKAELINAAAARIPPPPGTLWLDSAALTASSVVRPARAGDRMQPYGASHSYSVSDLLRDAGVAPHRRFYHPVIQSGDSLIAIPPYRIAESCKITSATESAVKLTLEAVTQTPLFELQDFYDRPEPLPSGTRQGRRREEITQA